MNHSGNFGRALEKPGFFSELKIIIDHSQKMSNVPYHGLIRKTPDIRAMRVKF